MNILNVIDRCSQFLKAAKKELGYGNDFCAEQNLVRMRELLNTQPELEAGGSHRSTESPYIK